VRKLPPIPPLPPIRQIPIDNLGDYLYDRGKAIEELARVGLAAIHYRARQAQDVHEAIEKVARLTQGTRKTPDSHFT
jgi:hypothetical protein